MLRRLFLAAGQDHGPVDFDFFLFVLDHCIYIQGVVHALSYAAIASWNFMSLLLFSRHLASLGSQERIEVLLWVGYKAPFSEGLRNALRALLGRESREGLSELAGASRISSVGRYPREED